MDLCDLILRPIASGCSGIGGLVHKRRRPLGWDRDGALCEGARSLRHIMNKAETSLLEARTGKPAQTSTQLNRLHCGME
jgi:hypothetical protein